MVVLNIELDENDGIDKYQALPLKKREALDNEKNELRLSIDYLKEIINTMEVEKVKTR